MGRTSCPGVWPDRDRLELDQSQDRRRSLSINTRRKFLDHRLELAQHEWARLKANDSLECRNCHSAVAMDLSKQTERAATIHTRYLLSRQATCIDCHKGIAHELPNMEGIDPGWKVPPELQGDQPPQSSAIETLQRMVSAAHADVPGWSSQPSSTAP